MPGIERNAIIVYNDAKNNAYDYTSIYIRRWMICRHDVNVHILTLRAVALCLVSQTDNNNKKGGSHMISSCHRLLRPLQNLDVSYTRINSVSLYATDRREQGEYWWNRK